MVIIVVVVVVTVAAPPPVEEAVAAVRHAQKLLNTLYLFSHLIKMCI